MLITKEWLEEKEACKDGQDWFFAQDKTDSIDVLNALIKDDKLEWANWLIVRVMDYNQYVQYAVYAAEQVIANYEKQYPEDKRPREAIEAAKKCIQNKTDDNISAADSAASAASAADSAASAARAADSAARAAYRAADSAASVAYSAADSAARAAYSAASATSAAYSAAEKEMQLKILNYGLKLLEDK